MTNLNWCCYSYPTGPPPASSLSSSFSFSSSSSVFQTLVHRLLSSTNLLCVSILAEFNRPFSLCLSVGDPELSSNMTSQHGLSLFSPSLVFFLLISSVCPSPARLCSPLHQVRRTEGWDLQQRVLLSRGFDQMESQERSLTDC